MSVQRYEDMHEVWHDKLDKAADHIEETIELISEIPPSVLTAISVWGEKGVQIGDGKIVKIDVVGHASFRERCLLIQRLLSAIKKELNEDLSI